MPTAELPKYQQVKRDLIRQIRTGRWRPDAAFPSESELLKRFDVSRPTLVRSLGDLVREGYLYRRKGQGTFVAFGRSASRRTTVLPVFVNALTAALRGEAREVLMQILGGIQPAAGDMHPGVVIRQASPTELDEQTQRFIDAALPGPALILEPSFNPALFDYLNEQGWDVWGVNEPTDRGNCVFIDQRQAGYLATRYLLDRGCRRIALLNGPQEAYWGFAARFRGYRDALEDAGIELNRALVREGHHAVDSEAGRAMMRNILDSATPFDGVVGVSDAKAIGARSVIEEAGRRVPQNITVIAIDNTLAGRLDPPLPAGTNPIDEVGRQAAEHALRPPTQKDDAPSVFAHIQLQPRLSPT